MSKCVLRNVLAGFALTALSAFAAPVVTVGTSSIVFAYATGGAVPVAQNVAVTSDIATTITGFNVAYISGGNPGWLSVFPPGPQNTPANLSFSVTPNALTAGTYIARVTISAGAVEPTSSLTITVFLTVSGGLGGPPTQTITAAPVALAFAWAAGSVLPAPQNLAVTVNDSAAFSVSRTTNTGTPWLTVSPASSASPGNVVVTANPTGLASGTYTGTITLTAPFAVVQVPVTLDVSGLGIAASPATVSLNVPQNYGVSAPLPVRITSAGSVPFQTSTLSEGNWLQVDIPSGNTPAILQVRANTSGLSPGTYLGTLTVRSGSLTSTDIGIALTVGPPASVGLQPATLNFTYTIGDPIPATQTTRINSLSANSQPFTFATTSTDNISWFTASANQLTTPAVMTVQATPANLPAGSYSGLVNILPTVASAAPQPIQVLLTVKSPPPPVILSIASSASYGTAAISPGQYVTLFGSNIGPKDLALPPAGTTPRTLGNTTVTFDGIAAPILYASATQTGVQVPYSVIAGQQSSLVVTYNNLTSAVAKINVLAAYPGLFTADSSGRGPAAALNADLSYNTAANPAARGAALVLYGTGEGVTVPASIEGVLTPVIAPIPATQLPVSVFIGGQQAQVLYAGETPGLLSGLFQINVRVPDTAPVGSAVPVVVTLNGIPSQANVTVAIK